MHRHPTLNGYLEVLRKEPIDLKEIITRFPCDHEHKKLTEARHTVLSVRDRIAQYCKKYPERQKPFHSILDLIATTHQNIVSLENILPEKFSGDQLVNASLRVMPQHGNAQEKPIVSFSRLIVETGLAYPFLLYIANDHPADNVALYEEASLWATTKKDPAILSMLIQHQTAKYITYLLVPSKDAGETDLMIA